ncbi:MAG: hypothetical protein EOP51_19825 [Sphingobacteriales bacterium]|nr:MAG: hypothetical protein EOP51_19825 [Sphingobacteriales bacterium]
MKNYQLNISILLLLAVTLFTAGCKKDKKIEPAYTCTTCKTTPDALAANNTVNKGIYKGVVVGSTGVITINVQNSGATTTSTLVLDGNTINLTSATPVVAGEAFEGEFTGTSGGQTFSFTFSVNANGSEPEASDYSIPGHPATAFLIIKETSDNLIKCYEGTTAGKKDNGQIQGSTINLITSGKTNTWFALSKDNGSAEISGALGTISGNTLTCDCGPQTTVTMILTDDALNGTYKGEDNAGTITAKRTL